MLGTAGPAENGWLALIIPIHALTGGSSAAGGYRVSIIRRAFRFIRTDHLGKWQDSTGPFLSSEKQ